MPSPKALDLMLHSRIPVFWPRSRRSIREKRCIPTPAKDLGTAFASPSDNGEGWPRDLIEMRGRVLHGLSGCAKFRLLSARFKESFPRDEPYVLELSAPHFLPAAAAFSGLEGSDPRQFPLESEGLDRTLQKEHEMTGKEIDGSHEMPHCSPAAGTCPRVDEYRSEERRVEKECRSRWSP